MQTIGSDQLRKAIERNRAKQVKREDYKETYSSKKDIIVPATYSPMEIAPKKLNSRSNVNNVSYLTKINFKGITLIDILVRGAWLFNFFLLLRLIFSQGGVIDYYKTQNYLDEKNLILKKTKEENQSLKDEIIRIQKDPSYQKKLVRDHLGVISKDEYIVMFASDR